MSGEEARDPQLPKCTDQIFYLDCQATPQPHPGGGDQSHLLELWAMLRPACREPHCPTCTRSLGHHGVSVDVAETSRSSKPCLQSWVSASSAVARSLAFSPPANPSWINSWQDREAARRAPVPEIICFKSRPPTHCADGECPGWPWLADVTMWAGTAALQRTRLTLPVTASPPPLKAHSIHAAESTRLPEPGCHPPNLGQAGQGLLLGAGGHSPS